MFDGALAGGPMSILDVEPPHLEENFCADYSTLDQDPSWTS